MATNTPQLGDGQYVTTSSISITGGPSRSTLKAEDVVGTSTLSTAAFTTATLTATSTASVGGAVTMQSTAQVRSALTAVGWLYGDVFISSSTTAQSGATSKVSQQGQMYFSVLSLTTNGGEFGFRSGNTVYRFASVAVG